MHIPEKLLEMLGQRENHGLALIGNIGSLPIPELSLGKSGCIRRASDDEAAHLWMAMRSLQPADLVTSRNPFETKVVQRSFIIEGKDATFNDLAPLESAQFRYHVLQYPELAASEGMLENASLLTEFPLFVLYGVTATGGKNQGWGPTRNAARFFMETDRSDVYFRELSETWCSEIGHVYSTLSSHDSATIPLVESLEEYRALQDIESHPRMLFLGLFTLLEKLLTHKPNPEDRYDSLTRQIRVKMTLLNPRFIRPLAYPGVGAVSALNEKQSKDLWKDLYSLRSTIAHGDTPNFKNELKRLVALSTAEAFLRCALRAVMRQALEEPRLLADLRNC